MQSERKQNRPEMTTERETIWEVLTFKICLLILVVISAGKGGGRKQPEQCLLLPYKGNLKWDFKGTRLGQS